MLSALKNSAIAWQVRRTSLWTWYRRSAAQAAEIGFYERLLSASTPGCIVDVGANTGGKTEIFLNLASHVVAVEPDPVSADTLRKRFRWKAVKVRESAISSESGRIIFYRFAAGSAFNTVSVEWVQSMIDGSNHMRQRLPQPTSLEVRAETIADLEAECRPVKYLKIDTEGFEDKVLSTLTVPIPLISMEFNFPQMWDAMLACVRTLRNIDGGYLFNVAITEPPITFASDTWLGGDEIVSAIQSRGWMYVELYARLTSS
jgi:FkbM family methyltransferase